VAGLRAAQSRLLAGTRFLDVWLYQDPPAALADVTRWRLVAPPGAPQVRLTAAGVVAGPTPHIELTLDGEPSVARYRLEVDPDAPPPVAFDPLRTWILVRLRPECPDLGSCADPPAPPDVAKPSPVRDYRARDWRSLRRALLEFLRTLDPDADLSVADPTVALVELFAHAGDLLAYQQDRVATEAYLETARLRTSVRRHARLVDFPVRSGASARTFVHLSVSPNEAAVDVVAGDVASDAFGSSLAFTLESDLTARDALGEVAIHDWGEDACCLPVGATGCVLVRPLPADPLGAAWLEAGQWLAFEVVDPLDRAMHARWTQRDPIQPWPTDPAAPAVPTFRAPLPSRVAQVVRLVEVAPFADPLRPPGLSLFRVSWRAEDALARPYPVGIDRGAGGDEVTVVRANVVPAHHGRLVGGPPGAELAPRPSEGAGPDEPTAAWWLTAAGTPRLGGAGLAFDAKGRPHRLDVTVSLPSGAPVDVNVLPTLLVAAPGALAVVVDVDDHEPPVLRFCTGSVGQAPPAGSAVAVRYEVGGGTVGNVPANALRVLEHNTTAGTAFAPEFAEVAAVTARNPSAASGGANPDPLDDVRRDAPEAFAASPRRAVLPADHAAAAAASPVVQRAIARRVWAGAWPVITTVVDLLVNDLTSTEGAAARAGLQVTLDGLRMLGTEAAVVSGTPVGLFLAIEVCLRPGAVPETVRAEILAKLRPGTDDRPGLFHPSRLLLGDAVYTSAVVAAVAALPAVDAVAVNEARRLNEPAGTLHHVLTFGPAEVPVLDDDPARPDHGRLSLSLRGR
jgi:hypothetical protein